MIRVEKIFLTDKEVWITTSDGREACEKFADFPRLKYATPKQRAVYSSDEFGIHWDELDEDLSFEGFFEKKNHTQLYKLFMAHPELNAAAIARQMGMKQSLLAAYISGTKKPSPQREHEIINTIRNIGRELSQLQFT